MKSVWGLVLVSTSDHALTRRCDFNVGDSRSKKIDIVSNFFPTPFGVIIDATHEVLDFLAEVFRASAEIEELLLASLESISSGYGILERDNLTSNRDVVPVSCVESDAV